MSKIELNIYKLHFTTPLHIGDYRDDYSISLKTIASDTLYAALISCLAKLGDATPLNGDLGCTVSSLFPFYQQNKESDAICFFPKPLKQTLPVSDKAIKDRKKIKKVEWLDLQYFEKVLNGEQLFEDDAIDNSIHKCFMTNQQIDDEFIVSQISPRVKVARVETAENKQSEPFYMDRIYFKGSSGLYFIAVGDNALLGKALDLLQSEGVGTDRNVGNGYFEYEQDTISLNIPDSANFAMSLSTFIPESKEQLCKMLGSSEVAYDFQRRGGWITTPPFNTYRKNFIHAFTCSSVFAEKCNGISIKGNVAVDLRPSISDEIKLMHPLWRCGRSLFLPVKI